MANSSWLCLFALDNTLSFDLDRFGFSLLNLRDGKGEDSVLEASLRLFSL